MVGHGVFQHCAFSTIRSPDRCDAKLYDALCLFFRLRNELLKTHEHTDESRGKCEAMVRELIVLVSAALGSDAVDKPNWHNLIALVFKAIRIVPNVHLFRTEQFERKNKGVCVVCGIVF